MPLKKIFFSYSRQDGAAFSLKLAVDLKKHGFNVWIDQQDIRAGTEWDIEVEKALETCDCLLFVETEKSVASNNVLDEVYYALGQNKRVIPLIVVDSKTPFRIQRIQHIDFTQNYHIGLERLIQELQAAGSSVFVEVAQPASTPKTFFQQYTSRLLIAATVAIAIAVLWYNFSHRANLTSDIKNTGNGKISSEADKNTGDTVAAVIKTEPVRSAKKLEKAEEITIEKPGNKKAGKKTVTASTFDIIDLEGDWALKDVDIKARFSDGYIKIEAADDKKCNIKSALRFFYIKPKDTAYLSIFNAFVVCSTCTLQEEIKLTVEDIAIGSQVYAILKHDQKGVGKAGDTIMNKGSNKSIRGTAVLQFTDNKTAVIKVARSTAVTLDGGLIVQPFVYSFTFKKLD